MRADSDRHPRERAPEDSVCDVVVVGAGPTGLACAAALADRGVEAVVLERGDDVGAAWRSRYRALRLNSGAAFSTLPGVRYPRGTPTFPTRDQVVGYLDEYRRRRGLDVRTRTRVLRLDREADAWVVRTDRGDLRARQVLVATGLLGMPALPAALGDAGPEKAAGPPVVHSADYVDAASYRGQDVLVVGAGSSGMEIAHDLVAGGARQVLLSVRTPPNLLPRAIAGMPGDPAVLLLRRLPPRLADTQLRVLSRLVFGDLTALGLPAPGEGPFTRLRRDGGSPAVVDREVVDDLRAGRIRVVGPVAGLEPGAVRLSTGEVVPVDAVVAATGFRPGLEPLVGHLGVLDAAGLPGAHDERAVLPGLRFVNYRMTPGLILAARGRARRAAAAVARELPAARPGAAGARRAPTAVSRSSPGGGWSPRARRRERRAAGRPP